MMTDPTRTTYQGLTEAYDFFNRGCSGRLPRCLITMQRQKGLWLFRRRALRHQGRAGGDGRDRVEPVAFPAPHDASRASRPWCTK